MNRDDPIVLFDGVCNLCNATVRFIIANEAGEHVRFASLQSPSGRTLAAAHGVTPGSLDSMLLVANGSLFRKSTAALKIARLLRFPWWLAYWLILVPRFVRDPIYDFIGRRRYRWFGMRPECVISHPGAEHRFLS